MCHCVFVLLCIRVCSILHRLHAIQFRLPLLRPNIELVFLRRHHWHHHDFDM